MSSTAFLYNSQLHPRRSKFIQIVTSLKIGDNLAREEIIIKYKPFVFKVVSKICGEFISSSDDEASVGLIAFNEAIDNYNPEKGASFYFCRNCHQAEINRFFGKKETIVFRYQV